MADRRRRPDQPPYSENGVRYDLLCDPKLTTDVQRHVSRVFERDTEHRALLTRIAMLTETLAADPSKLVVLQRLLARIEKVTDSKLEMLRSVNDMVGDLVQRCRVADGRPSSAASSSSEPEKPREAAACRRSSDDGHVQGAPVAKYTPQPTVSGTVHVNSLRKRVSKPVAKRTVPRKAKRRRVIRKKHKYSRYDDDDDDSSNSSSSSSNSNSSSSYDEPEDPNEPTYCLCDRVSFGKMICCDNDLCPIEWFHFRCISMTSKPKGKWFCPNCRGLRSNVMKPREQILKELKIYNEQKER